MMEKKIAHLPYKFDQETKFSHYEMLWKQTALTLLNKSIHPNVRKDTRILDIGCGRGEMMGLLLSEGYQVEGMDLDEECVQISSQYGVCQLGQVETMPQQYAQNNFDAVIALHVLEHLESPKMAIDSFKWVSGQYILLAVPNLSSFAFLNWSPKISSCNVGHVCGWNYSHLNNFLTNICDLKVIDWAIDCVPLYNTLPYLSKLDKWFHKSGIRAYFEERLLKKMFPRMSFSLIVLCEK